MEKVDKRLECRRCSDEAKAEANEEDGGAGWLKNGLCLMQTWDVTVRILIIRNWCGAASALTAMQKGSHMKETSARSIQNWANVPDDWFCADGEREVQE